MRLIKQVRNNYENYEFASIYHAVNNFCTLDLSAFYLDFAKDVLYIEAKDQSDRRAMQTVFYECLMTLPNYCHQFFLIQQMKCGLYSME